jgi:hypothetical protein
METFCCITNRPFRDWRSCLRSWICVAAGGRQRPEGGSRKAGVRKEESGGEQVLKPLLNIFGINCWM